MAKPSQPSPSEAPDYAVVLSGDEKEKTQSWNTWCDGNNCLHKLREAGLGKIKSSGNKDLTISGKLFQEDTWKFETGDSAPKPEPVKAKPKE